jgi:hypothetical protein
MTGAPEQLSNRDDKDKNENTNHHQNDGKCNKRPDVPRSSLLHGSLHTKRLALWGAKSNLTLIEYPTHFSDTALIRHIPVDYS